MKGKTSDSNINCFSFTSGFSLSLYDTDLVSFSRINKYNISGTNYFGLPTSNFNQPIVINSYTVASVYNAVFPIKLCSAISYNFILDTVIYYSGDQELKDFFGQLIT